MAPDYDAFTAEYRYEDWLAALEALLSAHGRRGRRLLDVACGTGKSFIPMLRRGYDVVACDISPAMVAAARRKVGGGGRARVRVADMRALPRLGTFDVVSCLDDAVNYLRDEAELRRCFAGVRANLAPGGLFVFDVNTLRTYRTAFASHHVSERDGRVFAWRGTGAADAPPGAEATAVLDVFSRGAGGAWERRRSTHTQRHYDLPTVAAALADADLELVAVHGQLPGARLRPVPDELRDVKRLHVARPRHPDPSPDPEEPGMLIGV